MSCITMAFVNDGIMGLVSKSVTREWHGGLSYLVVQGLMKKYQPTAIISKVEMRQQLNRIKMRKGTDPALLFEQFSSIEEQYLAPWDKIDEADLIAIVLNGHSKCKRKGTYLTRS